MPSQQANLIRCHRSHARVNADDAPTPRIVRSAARSSGTTAAITANVAAAAVRHHEQKARCRTH